jgi:hypothetical protein
MPIKVDLVEDERVVRIQCDGPLSRQEVGWAAERVRELLGETQRFGIFCDASRAEPFGSASLTGEMTENFLLALDTALPIAYVRPSAWSADFAAAVRSGVPHIPENSLVCDNATSAMKWLTSIVSPVGDAD